MSSEEDITIQAEMVYAADPGLPGYAPRVWAYRNTIKALNWYSSVRVKLDDPACECLQAAKQNQLSRWRHTLINVAVLCAPPFARK